MTAGAGGSYNRSTVTETSARGGAPAAGPLRATFRRADRIPEGDDFVGTVRKGRSVATARLRLLFRANGRARSRLGLSVSGKMGPAVRRNRFRRHAREAFRRMPALRAAGIDLVVIVRAKEALDDPGGLKRAFEQVAAHVSGREDGRSERSGQPAGGIAP